MGWPVGRFLMTRKFGNLCGVCLLPISSFSTSFLSHCARGAISRLKHSCWWWRKITGNLTVDRTNYMCHNFSYIVYRIAYNMYKVARGWCIAEFVFCCCDISFICDFVCTIHSVCVLFDYINFPSFLGNSLVFFLLLMNRRNDRSVLRRREYISLIKSLDLWLNPFNTFPEILSLDY